MTRQNLILHVAINTPLRHHFDYLAPTDWQPAKLQPSVRLLVPFGKRQCVGILLSSSKQSSVQANKLKHALAILDENPLLSPSIFKLNEWASNYYQHPIGEVMFGSLPQLLRQGNSSQLPQEDYWQLTTIGLALTKEQFNRAPQQAKLWQLLIQHDSGLTKAAMLAAGCSRHSIDHFIQKNYLQKTIPKQQKTTTPHYAQQLLPELNQQQQNAVTQINAAKNYQVFLLDGVTGSGKTEVYLRTIAQVLKENKQALILVPEIGLTPQTVSRFQQRFPEINIAVFHSGLSERERLQAWLNAAQGESKIIIGTRSAVFTPMANPGIIIIDEEHDLSFKQQHGFRYSARDLAILRGKFENIPVVLGTATPSLETIKNVDNSRFTRLLLSERIGKAMQPSFHIIDLRNQYLEEGLSPVLLQVMQQHLAQNSQILLFLNRRGFAPVLLCHTCGWSANCNRCDARLTLHNAPRFLICHHCGSQQKPHTTCPQCSSSALIQLGLGTERLEKALVKLFPNTKIARIDRDSTRHKGAMQKLLTDIHDGNSQILIGTQMLAKGHHFPNVTLVGIIDADCGIYSSDFRASERMAQLIIQVAGRAGRAEKPGQVFLQTHNPDHPLLLQLIKQNYTQFAQTLLTERQSAYWPPFSALSLLRAEATDAQSPLIFLKEASDIAEKSIDNKKIRLLGPIPAPMQRKAGKFRALFLLQAAERNSLQKWLPNFLMQIEKLKSARKVRWAIDIDPQELY